MSSPDKSTSSSRPQPVRRARVKQKELKWELGRIHWVWLIVLIQYQAQRQSIDDVGKLLFFKQIQAVDHTDHVALFDND